MPFGCPYPAGSDEAKQFMAELRAMRGQKAGKSALRKRRSRRGGGLGAKLGDFFKRFVKGVKYSVQEKGDLKDRFLNFADEMTGAREAKEQRNAIVAKLSRIQRMFLNDGRWYSEKVNGLPYELFLKITPKPPTNKTSGGAIPLFLVKLIGQLGLSAALRFWENTAEEARERAWRGGAWLGMDGEIHTSTVHPGMVGATRRGRGRTLYGTVYDPVKRLTMTDVKEALRAYAKKHPKNGGWELPHKIPPNPLEGIADAQRREREDLQKFIKEHLH